jgi:regulator of protease activity HflC (stomatin/prohibitin superfamily)
VALRAGWFEKGWVDMEPVIVVGVALALLLLLLMSRITRVTIFEYEKGLKYRKGKFDKILGPGAHLVYSPWSVVREVDIRPRFITIPGQEVLTSDGVTLKVSLAARFEVSEPEVAVNKSQDYVQALYLILQLALREIVGQATIDEVLADRRQFGDRLMELTGAPVAELGLNLLSVNVKDIMFPGELKKIFAQVVQAKQEGLAALERARGETAALRNLANAAKLANDNPALLQLRLLQQFGASEGNSLILGFPSPGTPSAVIVEKAPRTRKAAGGPAASE